MNLGGQIRIDICFVGFYSGYMSPEYALDGSFSVKSDVFSYGIVVLEIISGRRNTGFYQSKEALNLLGYVRIMNVFLRRSF